MENIRFYASGLRFSCKRCSTCCRYEPGYVYLSEKDVAELIQELKMERNSFIKTYCRWVRGRNRDEVLSLKEKINKDCIFWKDGCIVYNARPLQCITFPFWENIIASSESWNIAASDCPGMNTGQLHSESSIDRKIKSMDAQPAINRACNKGAEERI